MALSTSCQDRTSLSSTEHGPGRGASLLAKPSPQLYWERDGSGDSE